MVKYYQLKEIITLIYFILRKKAYPIMIRKVPIPTAGVMLGLAALGNLLAPYSLILKYACGISATFLGLLLFSKVILHPNMVKNDLNGNSIFASVFATFFMAIMQLSTYTFPFIPFISECIWYGAIIGHFILMTWFTYRYIINFDLREVFPTYFIAYVGIIVASVTAPTFNQHHLGEYIFWFGFIAYMLLFLLVTIRYCSKHTVAEPAKPLFCIYTAPMSLSLTGYLACAADKSLVMIIVMQILAQLLFIAVLTQMPKLLRLKFYPSYAAFTFPFVITAIALRQTVIYLNQINIAVPQILNYLVIIETILATAIVLYVFIRYLKFLHEQMIVNMGTRAKSVFGAIAHIVK